MPRFKYFIQERKKMMNYCDSLFYDCMEHCISLAKQTSLGVRGPYVGAVVLDSREQIIGEGWKDFLPGTSLLIHAERMALDQAATRERKPALLVTTLEPCIHNYKKHLFSSCSDLLIQRGIKTLVIGRRDHSEPFECGQCTAYLQSRGVEVIEYFRFIPDINAELMRPGIHYQNGARINIRDLPQTREIQRELQKEARLYARTYT